MKISISYPPIKNQKGTPLLSQNRQFQWFAEPTYIYPVVPAQAATLLAKNGFNVFWDDGIAEDFSYEKWISRISKESPDVIVIETKTPVVKLHWKIISELKDILPESKIVLIGDHVSALPSESMENSKVDYILTGGDYDFLLLNLLKNIKNPKDFEPGIWYRDGNKIKNTGHFVLNHDLNALPFIDRELTKWELYSKKNGNYKRTPGTYIMAARDCWWGKCTFCSWTTIYPGKDYRKRTPKSVLDEIGILVEKYKVKEIMDDSGTFPVGGWLNEFCEGMIDRGYNKKIRLNCNMRFGILKKKDFRLMRRAGFRFVLFGLESANQKTLDKVNKNLTIKDIVVGVKRAKLAGLDPHITAMMGYPWEKRKDAERTVKLAKKLFSKGYVDTLQATIVIPYPGTPLFRECNEKGWLKTKDWDHYDMRENVMKSKLTDEDVKKLTQGLYKSFLSPKFVLRKVLSIRDLSDLNFFLRAGKKLFGHLVDFKNSDNCECKK